MLSSWISSPGSSHGAAKFAALLGFATALFLTALLGFATALFLTALLGFATVLFLAALLVIVTPPVARESPTLRSVLQAGAGTDRLVVYPSTTGPRTAP